MDLTDTDTHKNLSEALDSASRGVRRMLWFAEQADVEGYPEIAATFRTAAEVQAGHANGHLEYLAEIGDPETGLPIGDAVDNLAAAIDAETTKATTVTPGFAAVARSEGLDEVAEWFDAVARAQERTIERLQAGVTTIR